MFYNLIKFIVAGSTLGKPELRVILDRNIHWSSATDVDCSVESFEQEQGLFIPWTKFQDRVNEFNEI